MKEISGISSQKQKLILYQYKYFRTPYQKEMPYCWVKHDYKTHTEYCFCDWTTGEVLFSHSVPASKQLSALGQLTGKFPLDHPTDE